MSDVGDEIDFEGSMSGEDDGSYSEFMDVDGDELGDEYLDDDGDYLDELGGDW